MKKISFCFVIALTVICSGSSVLLAASGSGLKEPTGEFERFFVAGGWLVWVVLLPLSLLTVSFIVQYLLVIRRKKLLPVATVTRAKKLLNDNNNEAELEWLGRDDSLLARTLRVGLLESRNGRAAMDHAMAEIIEEETTSWLRRIERLNIIGNVAPMIGLFGTVWGMINAFNGIVQAGGQPEPADLAGGISVALVTTWWGLVVAIPALAVYGFLRNRIDALSAEVAVTAEEVMRDIRTSGVP